MAGSVIAGAYRRRRYRSQWDRHFLSQREPGMALPAHAMDPPRLAAGPSWFSKSRLDQPNVRGLGSLLSLRNLEFDLLVLFEVAISLSLDGRVVHEHVGAILLGDEAIPLLGAEPLHGASCHKQSPPFL